MLVLSLIYRSVEALECICSSTVAITISELCFTMMQWQDDETPDDNKRMADAIGRLQQAEEISIERWDYLSSLPLWLLTGAKCCPKLRKLIIALAPDYADCLYNNQ